MNEGVNSPESFKTDKTFSTPNECDGLTNKKFVCNGIVYISTIGQDMG